MIILTNNLRYILSIFLDLTQTVFSYGIAIWGRSYNKHINVLFTTVSTLIKIILNKQIVFKKFNL